jgi:hypothetical protein
MSKQTRRLRYLLCIAANYIGSSPSRSPVGVLSGIMHFCRKDANDGLCNARQSRRSRSLRQLFAGLLAHHVLGVPVWPVLVALPAGTFLVLAVGRRRTPKCTRQIVR